MVTGRELTEIYLEQKLASLPSNDAAMTFQQKLVSTISTCAKLLKSHRPLEDSDQRLKIERIRKKLTGCQIPEDVDLTAVART